jgi:hypothetical protein
MGEGFHRFSNSYICRRYPKVHEESVLDKSLTFKYDTVIVVMLNTQARKRILLLLKSMTPCFRIESSCLSEDDVWCLMNAYLLLLGFCTY